MEGSIELDELTALFEEDGLDEGLENNISNGDEIVNDFTQDSVNASSSELDDMEVEYEQLQKQMQLLQEKMKSKKKLSTESCPNAVISTCVTNPTSPDSSTCDVKPTQKRSFREAFGLALNPVANSWNGPEQENVKISDDRKTASKTSKSPDKSSVVKGNNFYPSQKKPRISHAPQSSSLKSEIKPKSSVSQGFGQQQKQMIETELFSKIRLKKRFIDANDLKESMEGKLFLKPLLIRPTMNISEDRDWVTIGVVARHGDPQTDKNGKKFVIWHLSGLDDCTKVVSLFLFGKVYEELGKAIPVGMVVGLLNPTIMPPKKERGDSNKNFNSSPALTIDVSERLTKIGVAADLGWCNATKFRNKQPAGKCLAIINKQYGTVCVFHMKANHKKMSAKRGELQGTAGTGIPAKYKQTIWNQVKGEQFFYAGQTYSAAPPSTGRSASRKESKLKLTDILGSNLKESSSEKNVEMERSKIMQAISGIEEKQSLSGCTDKFAEMLASGDNIAGSRQFLNHLQKKKRAAIETTSTAKLSAADMLEQQKQQFEGRNKNSSTNASTSKNLTAADFLNKKMRSVEKKTSSTEISKTCAEKNSNLNPKSKSSSAKKRGADRNSNSNEKRQNISAMNLTSTSCVERSPNTKLSDAATHRLVESAELQAKVASVESRKDKTGAAKMATTDCTGDVTIDRICGGKNETVVANNRCVVARDSTQAVKGRTCNAKGSDDVAKILTGFAQDPADGAGDRTGVAKDQPAGVVAGAKSTVGGEKSASPSDVLLQMKRERYLKRKENMKVEKHSNSRSLPLLHSSSPQLGGDVAGSNVNLFGDWMIRRHAPKSTSTPSLAELRKKKAIDKLRNQSGQIHIEARDPNRPLIGSSNNVSSNEMKNRRLEDKVAANRKDLSNNDKENNKNVKKVFSKLSEKEFQKILNATSSHQYELDLEEMERQENYFNPLIKKEMMELKMSQTYEIPAKIVTCHQCNYTYWAAHERCKALRHDLAWNDVKKRFFECSKCKHRTTTWQPYPLRACKECGSEKLWRRTCMWKEKQLKFESETLLLRGVEHSKFLSSIKSGDW